MIEVMLREKLAKKKIPAIVKSAGIVDRDPTRASENARIAIKDFWLSLEEHRSSSFYRIKFTDFDRFIVVDESIESSIMDAGVPFEKIVILNEENGGIPNPYGQDLQAYRKCAQTINNALDELFKNNYF
jgi:protein-tyrosine-phosphatase